jgi:hypothetical protein
MLSSAIRIDMTADNNARSTQVTTWRATLKVRGMPPGKGAKKDAKKNRVPISLCILCVFA